MVPDQPLPVDNFGQSAPIGEPAPAVELDSTPIPLDQLPAHIRANMVEDDEVKGQSQIQVAFKWQGTTIDIGHFNKPRIVTVGSHPLNDFCVSDETFPDQNYPLLVPVGSSFGVFFTDKFTGSLEKQDGSVVDLAQVRSSSTPKAVMGMQGNVYTLDRSEVLTLKADELDVEFSYVYPTKAYSTALYRDFDFFYLRVTLFSFIAHFALILMFQFVPSDHSALSEQLLKGRFAKMIAVPPEKPKKPQEKKFTLKKKKKKKIEKKKEEKKPDKVVEKPDKNVDKKTRDLNRVKKSGLLGMLSQGMGSGGPGGDIFGKATQKKFLGNILGASGSGTAFGLGGMSGRGFGMGSGGGGGAYGGGGGFGHGGKRAYGRKGMRVKGGGRRKKSVRIRPGRLYLQGSLTRAQIARVVRMYWFQIKYCYEKELRKTPKLSGKIVIRWIISGTGHVQTANVIQTTMNNESVENCIVRRIVRWKFPTPKGGGVVVVNYPFLFTKAG